MRHDGASDSVSAPSAGGWVEVDSLSAADLMRVHVAVLFTHDADGYLDRVNEPDGAPAPRFFLPLYSTSWRSEGSLALARKLGLIQFGSDLHIT